MVDFHLQRFLDAHDAAGTYDSALVELRKGRKRGHWMWFVFPQLTGLGRSTTAQRYAISGPAEAQAYLDHPVLGPRLVACARALIESQATDPVEVLGAVDAQKLHSSMTLFASVERSDSVFTAVLDRFYASSLDEATTSRLRVT
jgi:uncharacterized protein (DUF1810 family)